MEAEVTRCVLLFSGRCQRAGYEGCADEGNHKEKRRQEIEEPFTTDVENVGESSQEVAYREPDETDDDSKSANREKRYTNNEEHVAGH